MPICMDSPSTVQGQSLRITAARQANLHPSAKLLLRTLVDYMGKKTHCWPRMRSLSQEIGLTIQHTRRLIRQLEAAGFIKTEIRHRSDGSQASNTFHWSWTPENTDVPPPEHPRSAIKHSREETSKPHAAKAECSLSEANKTKQRQTNSRRFIKIDGSNFRKPEEAKRVYDEAVAGKLINNGSVDKTTFYACWCEVCFKLTAGKVNHPERLMRFLLNDRRIMAEYPTLASETKARKLINHLYPMPTYNPHG